MSKDVLSIAWNRMCCRKFSEAVSLLEGKADIYEGDFEYYIMLATGFLYIGDIGSASTYFQKARRIKINDSRLLLGQAIIFLRRGDTGRALQYYLEVKDIDPSNQIAQNAMDFLRKNGDYDTICRCFDTGEIQKFFPPLGKNPYKPFYIFLPVVACVLGVLLTIILMPKINFNGSRMDLSTLELTAEEKQNIIEKDLSSQSFKYILTSKEISKAYSDAINYFQGHHDNLSQVEINRILNSNASIAVKKRALVLMGYLEDQTFDSIKDKIPYKQVENEPILYLDCWVVWSGRISNSVVNADDSLTCQLLVGYETMKNVDGIVNVYFDKQPSFQTDQSVSILGKVEIQDGAIVLKGKAIYQSVNKS